MSLSNEDLVKSAGTYARDLAERVATSFVTGFLGAVVVTAPLDVSMWKNALAGGVAAVASVLKGVIARARGEANSASLMRDV